LTNGLIDAQSSHERGDAARLGDGLQVSLCGGVVVILGRDRPADVGQSRHSVCTIADSDRFTCADA
jgi:hypothetical protein